MKLKIISSTVLLSGVLLYSSTLQAQPASSGKNAVRTAQVPGMINYKIIPAANNNTWGYDILKDHKILIHQPNRPGLPGIAGFSKKGDAVKVAKLVTAKIERGEMPPTVSVEELKQLGVL